MDDPVDQLELDGAWRDLVAAAEEEDDTIDVDSKKREFVFRRWTVTSTRAHPSILSQGCRRRDPTSPVRPVADPAGHLTSGNHFMLQ
jgi:hypothetical protein